jgi:hypothetical protein
VEFGGSYWRFSCGWLVHRVTMTGLRDHVADGCMGHVSVIEFNSGRMPNTWYPCLSEDSSALQPHYVSLKHKQCPVLIICSFPPLSAWNGLCQVPPSIKHWKLLQ